MSKFKAGDRIRWKSFPSLGQGEIVWVYEGSGHVNVKWDSQPDNTFFYTFSECVSFAKAQNPRDFPEESGKSADLPKYVLVEAKNKKFLQEVNELIAKGYKPQGGVVVDQQFYIQAMILED